MKTLRGEGGFLSSSSESNVRLPELQEEGFVNFKRVKDLYSINTITAVFLHPTTDTLEYLSRDER